MSELKNQADLFTFRQIDQNTWDFQNKCTNILHEILLKECQFGTNRNKSMWRWNNTFYPLSLVAISLRVKATILVTMAFYDPSMYQINLYTELCKNLSSEELKNLLRHELAHYLVHIKFGGDATPHGSYFQQVCRDYQWGKDVSQAIFQGNINAEQNVDEAERMLDQKKQIKIQKLLALAQSESNFFESELAKQYAKERIEQYQAEQLHLHHNAESWELWNWHPQLRMTYWHQCIVELLKIFPVKSVIAKHSSGTCVQIMGTKKDLEEAVAFISQVHLYTQNEWSLYQHSTGAKGKTSKHSFIRSLVHHLVGRFLHHQKQPNRTFAPDEFLPLLNQLSTPCEALEKAFKKVYPRLSHTRSSSGYDAAAAKGGLASAHKFQSKPGVNKSCEHYLPHRPAY